VIFHGNDKFFGQTFHRRKTLKNPYFDIKKKQIKKTRREIADGQSIGTRENYDKEFKFVKKKNFKKLKELHLFTQLQDQFQSFPDNLDLLLD